MAAAAAADLGVWMTDLHASGAQNDGGLKREVLAQRKNSDMLLIAVTVLTST